MLDVECLQITLSVFLLLVEPSDGSGVRYGKAWTPNIVVLASAYAWLCPCIGGCINKKKYTTIFQYTQCASISIYYRLGMRPAKRANERTSRVECVSVAWIECSHTIETIRTLTQHSYLFAIASAAAPIRRPTHTHTHRPDNTDESKWMLSVFIFLFFFACIFCPFGRSLVHRSMVK